MLFRRLFRVIAVMEIAVLMFWGVDLRTSRAASISLLRDSEIETALRDWAVPVFSVNALDAHAVRLYLVSDPTINAFVLGGQNIFIHTGLLTNSENVQQAIGVIAHEAGHVVGGHLVQHERVLRNASTTVAMGMLLGVGAAVLSGDGRAAIVGASAGSTFATSTFLSYSRAQEQIADEVALRTMEQLGLDVQYLYDFLLLLKHHGLGESTSANPYNRTHPLTSARLRSVKNTIDAQEYQRRQQDGVDATPSSAHSIAHRVAAMQEQFLRVQAKIFAYEHDFDTTMRRWAEDETSMAARHAHVIAWYRKGDLSRALTLMDALLTDYPDDIWFLETKAGILYHQGNYQAAIDIYEQVYQTALARVRADPDAIVGIALFALALSEAHIMGFEKTADPIFLEQAKENLQDALAREPTLAMAWHRLAGVRGRLGDSIGASVALAEEALLRRNIPQALEQAERVLARAPWGSRYHRRAQDIVFAARRKGVGVR